MPHSEDDEWKVQTERDSQCAGTRTAVSPVGVGGGWGVGDGSRHENSVCGLDIRGNKRGN